MVQFDFDMLFDRNIYALARIALKNERKLKSRHHG